ncbi:DNA polymerase [Streptosporangium sp. NPDC050855]|uniref:DNA polymerase n=1 Tax=Streptosporangium sp. NPDC050855 TaxID=3366194 RepID=UPI00378C00ED
MRLASNIVYDVEHLRHVIKEISRHDHFSWDIETIGPYATTPVRNDVAWIAFSAPGVDAVIPMRHPIGSRIIGETKEPRADKNGKVRYFRVPVWDEPPAQLRPSIVFEETFDLFESDREKIAQNLSFDAISIAKHRGGELPKPPFHCTLVSSWLLDENRLNGLKPRVREEFGSDYDQGHTGKHIASTAFDKVARYNLLDTRFTRWLRNRNLAQMAEQRLFPVFHLEMDVLEVLLAMGQEGAPLDVPALHDLREHLETLVEQQEADVYRAAGKAFNLNAARQVAEVLYYPQNRGGQGIKPHKLTSGGKKKKQAGERITQLDYTTDADELAKHAGNPVVDALLTYKETNKLLSTYVYGYLGDPTAKDRPCQIHSGRIHTNFKQYGTVTGRFSSSEPNLQNIPRPNTDLGKRIRGLFIAPPGYKLIIADYSQIELRVLAHFAGPGALFEGFQAGIDPHTITAAGILKLPHDQVTGTQRTDYGKRINFLIGYGGGEHLLAEVAKIPLREAEGIIALHKQGFPEIYAYKAKLLEVARSRRPCHIRTLTGRIRRVPDLLSPAKWIRLKAERQIINSHIQGSAADIIKIAMVRTHAELPEEAKLILTVHDELVTLVPDHLVEKAVEAIREGMLGAGIQSLLSVPLQSDIKIVDRWSEAKE